MKKVSIFYLLAVVIALVLQSCESKNKALARQMQGQIDSLKMQVDSIQIAKISGEVLIGINKDTVQAYLPFDPQRVLADSLKWANEADSIQTLGRALVWREKEAYKKRLKIFLEINRKSDAIIEKLKVGIDSLNLSRNRVLDSQKVYASGGS